MRFRQLIVVLGITVLGVAAARAEIIELPSLGPAATEWSMFVIKDPRKISLPRATFEMKQLLAPLGRQPCFLATDRGGAISCSDGAVTVSASHAYSYNLQLSFPTVLSELKSLDPKLYKGVKFPDGVRQAWAVNFLPPPTDGVTPCTGACNVVGPITLSFSTPVAGFGVYIDNGDTVALTGSIRVVVNGGELVRDLQLGVNPLFVEDIDPATGEPLPIDSVTIEFSGGASQAVILDRLSYEPLP